MPLYLGSEKKAKVNVVNPNLKLDKIIKITKNDTYDVTNYASAEVDVPSKAPVLQSKSATPKDTEQLIEPNDGYDGLSSVLINPIPSDYVLPQGMTTIYDNGTYDISKYKDVHVSVFPRLGHVSITKNGMHYASDSGFQGFASVDVNVLPKNAEQATPTIVFNEETGEITAISTQEEGYVLSGTKTSTTALSTKGPDAFVSGIEDIVAVQAGTYVTGNIVVAALPEAEEAKF